MKKSILFAIAAIALFATSCNKEKKINDDNFIKKGQIKSISGSMLSAGDMHGMGLTCYLDKYKDTVPFYVVLERTHKICDSLFGNTDGMTDQEFSRFIVNIYDSCGLFEFDKITLKEPEKLLEGISNLEPDTSLRSAMIDISKNTDTGITRLDYVQNRLSLVFCSNEISSMKLNSGLSIYENSFELVNGRYGNSMSYPMKKSVNQIDEDAYWFIFNIVYWTTAGNWQFAQNLATVEAISASAKALK